MSDYDQFSAPYRPGLSDRMFDEPESDVIEECPRCGGHVEVHGDGSVYCVEMNGKTDTDDRGCGWKDEDIQPEDLL